MHTDVLQREILSGFRDLQQRKICGASIAGYLTLDSAMKRKQVKFNGGREVRLDSVARGVSLKEASPWLNTCNGNP